MMSFNAYRESHKTKDNKLITNTRMGDKDIGLYPGKYNMDNYEEFLDKYCDHITSGKFEFMTEKQIDEPVILVDLDFRYSNDIETRQHDGEFMDEIVRGYKNILDEISLTKNDYCINVFERKDIYTARDEYNKDGIHIIIELRASHAEQLLIRKMVMEKLVDHFKKLPLINDLEDVFDIGISKGSCNWMLYGSRKPGYEPYELTYQYSIEGEQFYCTIEPKMRDIKQFLKDTSARLTHHPRIVVKDEYKPVVKPKLKTAPMAVQTSNDKNDDLFKFADLIDVEDINNYHSWRDMIWACASMDNFELAHYISQRDVDKYSGDEDETRNIYDSADGRIKAGTFYHYAKKGDPSEFRKLMMERTDFSIFTEITNQCEELTDKEVADIFIYYHGRDHIYYDREFYNYNGVYWRPDCGNIIRAKLLDDIVPKTNHYIAKLMYSMNEPKNKDRQEVIDKQINKWIKQRNEMKRSAFHKKFLDQLTIRIEKHIDEHQWELNPNAVCFKDCVYYIDKDEFAEGRQEDYMILNTGYEWQEPSDQDVRELEQIIETILPVKEERNLYMTTLATGIHGKTLEKFIMATGFGGNGKGVINELASSAVGNYCYDTMPNQVLMDSISAKNNPAVANMDNKRLVFCREPSTTNTSMNISTIKEITGGEKIGARMNYSNKMEVSLKSTLIMECNEKPNIDGVKDNASLRRLQIVLFRSTFVSRNKIHEYEGMEHVFVGNPTYKDREFKERYKYAMMKLLMRYFKELRDNNMDYDTFVPPELQKETLSYLQENDELYSWFMEHTVKEEGEFISIKDFISEYKDSVGLSGREARKWTKKKVIAKLMASEFFRKIFRERYQPVNNGKRIDKRNVFVGYRFKDDEEIEEI